VAQSMSYGSEMLTVPASLVHAPASGGKIQAVHSVRTGPGHAVGLRPRWLQADLRPEARVARELPASCSDQSEGCPAITYRTPLGLRSWLLPSTPEPEAAARALGYSLLSCPEC
jgi:hypothetical protein